MLPGFSGAIGGGFSRYVWLDSAPTWCALDFARWQLWFYGFLRTQFYPPSWEGHFTKKVTISIIPKRASAELPGWWHQNLASLSSTLKSTLQSRNQSSFESSPERSRYRHSFLSSSPLERRGFWRQGLGMFWAYHWKISQPHSSPTKHFHTKTKNPQNPDQRTSNPGFLLHPKPCLPTVFYQVYTPTNPLLSKPTRLHTPSKFNIYTQNDAIFKAGDTYIVPKFIIFGIYVKMDGCKTMFLSIEKNPFSFQPGHVPIFRWKFQDALWNLITYCAATGGSVLVIGSAAGVAFMGMASWMAWKMNFSFLGGKFGQFSREKC